jgi:Sulfatase
MMGRLRRLHPFLFVAIPVLNVMVRNPGAATLRDLLTLALTMLVACALVYAAAILALRNRVEPEAVPLLVSLAVGLFYAYPMLRAAYNQTRGEPGRLMMTGTVLLALVVAALAGVWWLARRPAVLIRANTFFGVMGLLLIAFLGTRLFADQLRARSQVRSSVLARRLSQPLPLKSRPRSESSSDIYIVILDEYANSSVLRERFGFNNRAFEDSLRRLGFTIPTLVRSNYAQTLLSLPSLLNFSYLTELERELGPRQTDPTLPNHLVETNRTVSFLKSRGYRVVFFPSQWWLSTSRNRHADFQFSAWNGFHLGRAATRSDLRRAFVSRTPLALLRHGDHHDADYVKRVLSGLGQSPSDSAPTFAFAHILNPHYPYVFDADCRPYSKRPARRWGQGRENDYLEQVRCLNHLLLSTVTQLVQGSKADPIILLVSDHGSNSLDYSSSATAEAVSPEQARERLGAFGAFRLPGSGNASIPDSVTLVNLIPLVLNSYFDASLPLSPDSLYMSLEKTPYLFAPVDPADLTPQR